MNKTVRNIFIALSITILAGILAACYIPSPLYGTWADGNGREKIVFNDDGSFSATILNSDDSTTDYSGIWSTVDNILVLNIQEPSRYSRNCPWDLKGAILYLTWTGEDTEKTLTLYHTAR